MNKKGLIALAIGTFALGITEFVMMGILEPISSYFGVSVSEGGHLISAYAIGVCMGAPALLVARKTDLRLLMIILAGVICLGNLFCAFAPGFWWLFAARFIAGLPHGAYFGVGAIVARKLAPPEKSTLAVSLMIAGMTVATLAGVPLATFITEYMSWRFAFMIVSLCGLLTVIAIKYWVPKVDKLPDMGFKGQFKFLRTLPPWLIFGGVIFGQVGFYCWYSYIEPVMLKVTGFSISAMPLIMVLAGLGMFCGNLIAGKLSVRYKPAAVSAAVMGGGVIVLLLFYFGAGNMITALPLMMLGTAALFGSGGPLQSSIVGYSKGGEMLGAASIQIAYNAGNAIAAKIGGSLITMTGSLLSPTLAGMPIALVGCGLLLILYRRYERA